MLANTLLKTKVSIHFQLKIILFHYCRSIREKMILALSVDKAAGGPFKQQLVRYVHKELVLSLDHKAHLTRIYKLYNINHVIILRTFHLISKLLILY